MSDSTIKQIDGFFDWLDSSVDAADRVLNRHKYTEEQHLERRAKGRREIIDADCGKPKAKEAGEANKSKASRPTAVATKPRFYILESVDPNSGHTIFVVTDGRAARTECSTREFAAQILSALEKGP